MRCSAITIQTWFTPVASALLLTHIAQGQIRHRALDESFSQVILNPVDEYIAQAWEDASDDGASSWSFVVAADDLIYATNDPLYIESFITFDLSYSWFDHIEDYLSSATLKLYSLNGDSNKTVFDILLDEADQDDDSEDDDSEWNVDSIIGVPNCGVSTPCLVEVDLTDGLLWSVDQRPEAQSLTVRISADQDPIQGAFAASNYKGGMFAPRLILDFDRHENVDEIQGNPMQLRRGDLKGNRHSDKQRKKKKAKKQQGKILAKLDQIKPTKPDKKQNANANKQKDKLDKNKPSGGSKPSNSKTKPDKEQNANANKPKNKPGTGAKPDSKPNADKNTPLSGNKPSMNKPNADKNKPGSGNKPSNNKPNADKNKPLSGSKPSNNKPNKPVNIKPSGSKNGPPNANEPNNNKPIERPNQKPTKPKNKPSRPNQLVKPGNKPGGANNNKPGVNKPSGGNNTPLNSQPDATHVSVTMPLNDEPTSGTGGGEYKPATGNSGTASAYQVIDEPLTIPSSDTPSANELIDGQLTFSSSGTSPANELIDVPLTSRPSTSPSEIKGKETSSPDMNTANMIYSILESKKDAIDNKLFLYQGSEPSTVYRYDGFVAGLRVMTESGVAGKYYYLGDDSANGYKYGLANLAAFIGQSMKETIQYDACDENSWDLVNGKYPLSNACGQLGQKYQEYHCSEEEKHMECPVDPNMSIKAVTHAKWYGAPGPLFCGPKSEYPFTGFWDYGYGCNNPWANPPELCEDYEGQKAGRYDNTAPVANVAGRTDVEGCCWWGRGVIQTTGICNFGKLNYFLGARAAKEGRDAHYPDIDFCKDPEVICASQEHQELKWIAGMFYWIESLQSYNERGWDYVTELHKFVDGGMTDSSFINGVSGVVNRGCHDPPCGTGEVDGLIERAGNFQKVLQEFLA